MPSDLNLQGKRAKPFWLENIPLLAAAALAVLIAAMLAVATYLA
jgi:hypothetical protein